MKLTPQQIKTIDYTSVFRAKITFMLSFNKKWTFPYTFVLEDVIIYMAALAIVRRFLGRVIDSIGALIVFNSINMFGGVAISLALPYLILWGIKKLPTDGKPIFYYLYDVIYYELNVLMPKKYLYKGGYQRQGNDAIIFKKE